MLVLERKFPFRITEACLLLILTPYPRLSHVENCVKISPGVRSDDNGCTCFLLFLVVFSPAEKNPSSVTLKRI